MNTKDLPASAKAIYEAVEPALMFFVIGDIVFLYFMATDIYESWWA